MKSVHRAIKGLSTLTAIGFFIVTNSIAISGCKPIAGDQRKDGKESAISLVQSYQLPGLPSETIKARIERIIDLSRKAGHERRSCRLVVLSIG